MGYGSWGGFRGYVPGVTTGGNVGMRKIATKVGGSGTEQTNNKPKKPKKSTWLQRIWKRFFK